MSGICGIFRLNGGPPEGIEAMAAHLERRGPDGTRLFRDGPLALGHTALNTTPESLHEALPFTHAETGCTITADLRLDNREELIAALGLDAAGRVIGDGEIVLRAYLRWGEDCPARLLGDFAFAIWDPRERRLFCARDQMGMKQLIHCHVPGRLFAFASEPKAVLKAEGVPRRINEGRIADFLEDYLEGIDFTSTFFEEVFRLPPAHCLTVSADRFDLRRYWRLEPAPELKLGSDRAYAEAFLETFTEAVRPRLRVNGPVGSMLSGGMDSGAVVAVASRLLAAEGRGPLHTFSGVGPDPETCVETRAIHSSLTLPGLAPHLISEDVMAAQIETLRHRVRTVDEPFDGHMTLLMLIYDLARDTGVRVVLDGVAGDVAFSAGSRTAHLFRRGRWLQLWREIEGQAQFWGFQGWTRRHGLMEAIRQGLAPDWMRRWRRRWQDRRAMTPIGGLLDPAMARRVDLAARRRQYLSHGAPERADQRAQRAASIQSPNLTVGRERYDRLAAAAGVEPRDPFLDIRLLSFCLSLPADQAECDGWPKPVLRRAMVGLLPETTIFRPGKEHLGAMFTFRMLDGWTGWRDGIGVADMQAFTNSAATGCAISGHHESGLVSHKNEIGLFYLSNWLVANRELREIDPAGPLREGRQWT